MEERYSGVDILEALESADHYNDYLTDLVRQAAATSKDLIDFGAGVGTFSKRLRQAGCHVVCIEPDPLQRQRLIKDGFETLADLGSLPEGSVPFIFSLNVLEHIEDDGGTISQIYRKLRPGGSLLVYVPAFHCLWSSLDDKVCHYRRYTRKTLRRLVETAGFSVETVRYADCLGFVAALIFRLCGRNAETLTKGSICFYDRWIFPPSRILDIALHPFFGKNVYVVCRK
jgi:SAM-dependent methyltransferase